MMSIILALGIAGSQLAATGQRPDPCALVSMADAAKAARSSITRRITTRLGSGITCTYETGAPGHSVLLTVYHTASRGAAAVTFKRDLQANAGLFVLPPVTVAHLGDAAQAFGHVLWVRRRNVIFVINVIDASARGATLKRAQALAREAIARIDASAR